MLLRASGEIQGSPVDVQAVRDDSAAADSGIPHAPALLAWADATVRGDDRSIAEARASVVAEMDAAAAVDAAAVIGNFERMTRIADATGIPLDAPMNALAATIQDELGLREFRSAANSERPGAIAAGAARVLSPLAFRAMAVFAGRAKSKNRED